MWCSLTTFVDCMSREWSSPTSSVLTFRPGEITTSDIASVYGSTFFCLISGCGRKESHPFPNTFNNHVLASKRFGQPSEQAVVLHETRFLDLYNSAHLYIQQQRGASFQGEVNVHLKLIPHPGPHLDSKSSDRTSRGCPSWISFLKYMFPISFLTVIISFRS